MSRRRKSGHSSLELLLDTICNTFGGILFVAILIVVMLRLTSKTTADTDLPQPTELEQLELEKQYAELQSTLTSLSKAMEALGALPQPDDPDTGELFEELKKRQETRRELFEKRLTLLKSIAELQTEINKTSKELQDGTEKRKAVENKREDLDLAVKEAVAKRTQNIEYSKLRRSSKQEVGVILRYGRLYVWHRYGASGIPLGLNTEEFVVLEDSAGSIRSTPNPAAGTPVTDTDESKRAVRSRLKRFDPDDQVIAIIVWPDSFEEFRYVKEAMLDLGFNYRIMPMEPGKKVFDRGGSSEGVQ